MSLTVQFTDTSTGEVVDWFWDFDDGTYDTVPNPLHTFPAGGTYNVTLHILGAYGGYDMHAEPVTVTAEVDPCGVTFDFTVSDGGWYVPAGKEGVYVPGTGFLYTDVLTTQHGSAIVRHLRGVRIQLDFPSYEIPVGSGRVEVVAHGLWAGNNGAAAHGFVGGIIVQTSASAEIFSVAPINEGSPAPAPVAATWSRIPGLLPVGGFISLLIEIDSSSFTTLNFYDGYVLITDLTVTCGVP